MRGKGKLPRTASSAYLRGHFGGNLGGPRRLQYIVPIVLSKLISWHLLSQVRESGREGESVRLHVVQRCIVPTLMEYNEGSSRISDRVRSQDDSPCILEV